jgi:hypothetical protein
LRAFAVELVALEVLQRLARAKRAADAARGIRHESISEKVKATSKQVNYVNTSDENALRIDHVDFT